MFTAVRLNAFVFCGMGLILGFLYFQSDYDQKGTKARSSLLYFSLIVTNLMVIRKYSKKSSSCPLSLINSSLAILGTVIFQRAAYYRERAARTYRSYTYLFGVLFSALPFLVIYTLLYT